jgi:hypothetical protein
LKKELGRSSLDKKSTDQFDSCSKTELNYKTEQFEMEISEMDYDSDFDVTWGS